jgi:hypothetical protein
MIDALRSERIEGFQPYKEFVEQRFGSSYAFIDMVGIRFTRIEKQLSALSHKVRNAEIARLQERIHSQTAAIEKLQKAAEIGFFLVLVPYYLGRILANLALYFLPISSDKRVEGVATFVSIVTGLALCLWKMRRDKGTHEQSGREPTNGPARGQGRSHKSELHAKTVFSEHRAPSETAHP